MLVEAESYEAARAAFRWEIPEFYNIGVDVCDKWAERDPSRIALICDKDEDEPATLVTFGELRDLSNACTAMFADFGVSVGDRVGILLPQQLETAVSHIALYKMGAIAIPLFTLFGPEALAHRLADSGARAVVTNAEGAAKLGPLRNGLPALEHIFCVDQGHGGVIDFHTELEKRPARFEPVKTRADDPAVIIYTSGTTGLPKGALHGHRVLLGHLPGVEMSHEFFPQAGDKIWTPADWAWIGGLLDVLLPALHHGVPVVARRFAKFTGEAAFSLMARHEVRNTFLPPTALKMMRSVTDAEHRWRLNLRTVASGGETLGAELLDWGRRTLGVTINEFYGQTECNMVVSSASNLGVNRAGCMGKSVPGHDVNVIDENGAICADGELGDIAVRGPDPVMFLGYWRNPAASSAKFRGNWLLTGDRGIRHADGFLQFVGRDDDVITSAGYRIGPGEIEDCLLRHPAVHMAAVVGKPDPERTEIVKAFIVLKPGIAASNDLGSELQGFVKMKLAAHEYPREIEFVDELPMTATGKIIRRTLRDRQS
jgi:acetyl-CoA synthetase